MDNRNNARKKDIRLGDLVICQQKKTRSKTPWEVKGSEVVIQRRVVRRAKNKSKMLKPRPTYLQTEREPEEGDLDRGGGDIICLYEQTCGGWGKRPGDAD